MAEAKFRPERFVPSTELMEWMAREHCDVAIIDVEGTSYSVKVEVEESDEVTEVDYRGCAAVGVGGIHSEEYGEEGGCCQWCGEMSPAR